MEKKKKIKKNKKNFILKNTKKKIKHDVVKMCGQKDIRFNGSTFSTDPKKKKKRIIFFLFTLT